MDSGRHPTKNLAFDLDGTLVDARGGIVDAVICGIGDALRAHGCSATPPTESEVIAALGRPALEFFRSLLPQDLHHLATESQERSTAHEVKALREGRVRLFPGTLEALRELRAGGRRLALISNAQRGYFDAAIDSLALESLFQFRCCHDDLEASERPVGKRALLGRALGELGAHGIMIGDRQDDFEAAAFHGCISVGLRCGFGTAEELAQADHLLESVSELPALLQRLWS